ncbi:response regulator, partial [bacterium]|nr:response regulator [bacterium]
MPSPVPAVVSKSIKKKLTLQFGGFVIIAMLLITSFSIYIYSTETKNLLYVSLNNNARDCLHTVEIQLETLLERTIRLSKNKLVVDGLLIHFEKKSQYMNLILSELSESTKSTKLTGKESVVSASIIDLKNQLVMSSNQENFSLHQKHNQNSNFNENLRLVLADGKVTMHIRRKHLIIIAPIKSSNIIKGALMVEYDFNAICKKLFSYYDQRMIKLFADSQLIFYQNFQENISYIKSIAKTYEPNTKIYKPNTLVNNLNITNETGIIKSTYTNNLMLIIVKLMAISFALILIAIALARKMGNQIADPILEFCSKAKDSNSDHTIRYSPIGTGDELESLAVALDEKTVKLQKTHQELEERIKNRTAELKSNNIKLNTEIEERRKAVIETKAAKQIKSDFLANISHEIRTPMNAIIGFTNLALETELDIKQSYYLIEISTASTSLLNILNDILDFSILEAGKLKFKHVNFCLTALTENLIARFNTQAKDKDLNLFFEINKNLPPAVYGDQRRLSQILNNFLSNAIKFTKKGAIKINIDLIDQNNSTAKIRFSVIDSGIGMEKGTLNKIFSSFSQVDTSTTREYGGTGLGLSLCKQLVDLMGGTISVESTIEKGSMFFFTLDMPIGDAAVLIHNASNNNDDNVHKNANKATTAKVSRNIDFPNNINSQNNLKGRRILLVEDNKINQRVALRKLETLGVEVDLAVNGKKAVKAVSNKNYDAILMDIQMPDMDGYKATAKIREQEDTGRVPIIAMTANDSKEDRQKSFKAGMDDHLNKPINKTVLYHTLVRLINPGQDMQFTTDHEKDFSRIKDNKILSEQNNENNKLEVAKSVTLENQDSLPDSLPGIDLQKGVKNLENNITLYKKLLNNFRRDHKDTDKLIKTAISENNLTN